ncbi:MAG: IS66 family transposase [Steroidobacteraceae bacterium]
MQSTDLAARLASMPELAALLDAERAASAQRIAELEKERDNLRASHERLRQELELFKRRLFIAKAERVDDTRQLELEFAAKMRELDAMAKTLGIAQDTSKSDDTPAKDGKRRGKRTNNRGTGRRDLSELPIEEVRIEIADPHLEKLVAEGKVQRHGFEETSKIAHRRASKVRVVTARVRYKTVDAEGNADVITAAMPPEMMPGSIAAPSLAAHIIMENIGKGMPLFRLEDSFAREGIPIDRGTLSRWKKAIGDRLAATVVKAMHRHALQTAFCISTDATGVCIQPIPSHEKGPQPCKKGHFLAMLADRDHVLFEYLDKENGKAIQAHFRGYSGYVQADAKSVFHLVFADATELEKKAPDLEHDGCERVEVGCWYHMRRRFWEAAIAKSQVGREGLVRIGRIFELDATWKDKPPSEIKRMREQFLRPHVESFFGWVDEQRLLFKSVRGYTRTALEYANNQRSVLTRFFDDGRLVLTNNGAERAVKAVALGRKAWLFCGSDDHAKSTAALFSLVASARLHGLDPEEYLRCLIRLVPMWPEHRMLELAPLFWTRTRARLDPVELEKEIGWVTVPAEPLDTSAAPEEQPPARF